MFGISQIITLSCFQAIVLATVLLHGKAELKNETLVITANRMLKAVYIDGTNQSLPFGEIWNVSDSVQMEPHARLIAFEAYGFDGTCSGVLASSIGNSLLLTDARFKCMGFNDVEWEQLGFDDSTWPNAAEYGDNTIGHSACSQKHIFANIDANAKWIWTDRPFEHFAVYCRGYTSLCDLSSPCLNNGTCLKNDQAMCSCLPQFTGRFCETELSTVTSEEITYETTTLTESTFPLSTTDKFGTIEVTTPGEVVSGSPADASRTTAVSTPNNITPDNNISHTTEATTTNHADVTTGSFGECTEQYYCNGPLEVPGSSIQHCYCPSGYLNTNDNCCLNQWWIIGLTLICAGVAIALVGAIIACFGCPCKSKKGGHTLEEGDAHGHGHASQPKAVNGLPKTGVGVTKGLGEEAVHSNAPPTVANGKAIHPAAVTATAVSMVSSAKPAPAHRQHPQSENDEITDFGTSNDLLHNPLMWELLNSEVGRTFRPSVVSIPSDIQCVIKRSSHTDEEV